MPYAGGIIYKANHLFGLNDAVSGHKNVPEWEECFVWAISGFMLKDEVSPNEINAGEANTRQDVSRVL